MPEVRNVGNIEISHNNEWDFVLLEQHIAFYNFRMQRINYYSYSELLLIFQFYSVFLKCRYKSQDEDNSACQLYIARSQRRL